MKTSNQYLCTQCGETFAKWFGKCPNCGEWNSIQEYKEYNSVSKGKPSGNDLTKKESISSTKSTEFLRIETGMHEIDRVLGGGFFPGSMTLFGGSPGVGKSTLALQIFDALFSQEKKIFYFSGEESAEQVLHRAERLIRGKNTNQKTLSQSIFSTHSLEDIITTVEHNKPEFIVVDSIQMVGLENAKLGNLSQIRINAEVLLKLAKTTNTAILIIGHVTKSDEIAGPKILEHIVDTVLQLEGENNSEIRILRSPKNRFGSTLEIGVFEMQGSGLQELKNPSSFFLSQRLHNATGSTITVMKEGARNFLIEIQALTVKTNFGLPRRTSSGVDLAKLHLLLAVISKFTPFSCDSFDAYINITSGMKVKEPASDLAILSALLSSRIEKEIPADHIIIGEVGLSGEVRNVPAIESRLREAENLGFKKAIIPYQNKKLEMFNTLTIVPIKTIQDLIRELFGGK